MSAGKEALDMALKETPDLIITDLNMPVMSGFDFIIALREQKNIRLRAGHGSHFSVLTRAKNRPATPPCAKCAKKPATTPTIWRS